MGSSDRFLSGPSEGQAPEGEGQEGQGGRSRREGRGWRSRRRSRRGGACRRGGRQETGRGRQETGRRSQESRGGSEEEISVGCHLAAGILIFLLSLPGGAFGQEPLVQGLVTGERVNLRTGPSVSTEVLASMHRGEELQVLEQRGDWVAVRLPERVSGYAAPGFVEPVTVERDRVWTVRVTADRLHVRSGPGEAYHSFGQVKRGVLLEARGRKLGWWVVRPPEEARGWIHRSFVVLLPPAQRLPEGSSPLEEMETHGDDRGVQETGTAGRDDPGSPDASQRRQAADPVG
ncbi:MAG: hypothetical protein COV76_05820 [Candidatus Omnitrophica bacterium CG11_big_fil_rev_8_21_14_0_20_64_10]|nr:MAG: hypothetical protein COV76_05820 [Candidatus Omnitrophica bacterium CG11_big_fil_rev_8_21_14_0_20_64_10]